jgi:hypothetical protein
MAARYWLCRRGAISRNLVPDVSKRYIAGKAGGMINHHSRPLFFCPMGAWKTMILFHQSACVFNVIRVRNSLGSKLRLWLSDEERLQHLYFHLKRHHKKSMRWLYKCDVPRTLVKELRSGIFVCYFDVVPMARYRIIEGEGCKPYMSFERDDFMN